MTSVAARLQRSYWTLPAAAVAAVVVFGINEGAYHDAYDALKGLGDRGSARTQIQNLLRRMIDAETGQRGYLLTARKEYLGPYSQSVKDVNESLQWLNDYYHDDKVLGPLMADIVKRSREKLSEVGTSIELHDEGKHDAWRELLLTDIGREKMESIREMTTRLLAAESDRVAVDRASLFATLRLSRIGVNAMVAISLLALILFLRQTRRFDAEQRRYAAELQAERDRLDDEVKRRTGDLTNLATYLQSASEDERSRLARELHDELGALLTAAKLDAARLKRGLGQMSPESEARLKHLNDTINSGIDLKRRIIEDLRPSSLSNLGLVAALEIQAREFAKRSEIEVLTEFEPVPLDERSEITVYRMVQESFTNIAKYAGAKVVTVTLKRDGDRAAVVVSDDGKGFDTHVQHGSAHGLVGMRYRVESTGGAMQVESAPGQGTRVKAWLPLHADTPAQAPEDSMPHDVS